MTDMEQIVSPKAFKPIQYPPPRTPHPPVSPPTRSSSLAFQINQRSGENDAEQDGDRARSMGSSHLFQPNIGRKRRITTPSAQHAESLGNMVQRQKILQAAKATLHRDMFAASSPASSIESRMNLDQNAPASGGNMLVMGAAGQHIEQNTRSWRYSTAPQNLAMASTDVREPLPSPTLPDMPACEHFQGAFDNVAEPLSSGFSSPNISESAFHIQDAVSKALPASQPQSEDEEECSHVHSLAALMINYEIGLEQPMERLNISNNEHELSSIDGVPLAGHARMYSTGTSMEMQQDSSPERELYLSPAAQAAAESARAKRKMMENTYATTGDGESEYAGILHRPLPIVLGPSPGVHRVSSITPCPNPAAHGIRPLIAQRPLSEVTSDMSIAAEVRHFTQSVPPPVVPRATATGSPMPFLRPRPRLAAAMQSQALSPTPTQQARQVVNTLNEHFRPGWYYAREPMRPQSRQAYSFSTATSKVVGSNQAPDSRIRDSYMTDTLTTLARPPSRYRKNGIGAEVAPRGVGRYYQRPPSSGRPQSAKARPGSRQTQNSGTSDVRFRSSPPRGPDPDRYVPFQRKRAMDDSFVVVDDNDPPSQIVGPSLQLQGSDDIIKVDEQTKAAVRLSIFGTNTLEALRHARQGLRELSPNVQLYRKGTQEHSHLRKKRRPSYWDNDLKEVRESPAGRGGVNSPVSMQASMMAEFDIASSRNTEMDLDETDLGGELVRAGIETEQRLAALGEQRSTNDENTDMNM